MGKDVKTDQPMPPAVVGERKAFTNASVGRDNKPKDDEPDAVVLKSAPTIEPVSDDVIRKVADDTGFNEGVPKHPVEQKVVKPILPPKPKTEAELIEEYLEILGQGKPISEFPDIMRTTFEQTKIQIYTKAPISAAFLAYKQLHGFKSQWDALESLMLAAGVIQK